MLCGSDVICLLYYFNKVKFLPNYIWHHINIFLDNIINLRKKHHTCNIIQKLKIWSAVFKVKKNGLQREGGRAFDESRAIAFDQRPLQAFGQVGERGVGVGDVHRIPPRPPFREVAVDEPAFYGVQKQLLIFWGQIVYG